MNILLISPNFNHACGVSRNVYSILKELSQKSNQKVFFITNDGDAIDKLYQLNINFYKINFDTGLKNLFHVRKNIDELYHFCKKNKIDIVHSHHRYPEYLAHIVSRKVSIKTIATAHSIVRGFMGIDAFGKSLSFKSNKIIAVSKFVANYLIKKFDVPREKIEVINNCVPHFEKVNNKELESLRKRLGINKDAKIFLFVGRISKSKGIDLLIDTTKKLQKKYSNIVLLLLGKDYGNYARKTDGKKIILIKQQPNTAPYYQLSDYVVLPSEMESFPFVMHEAGLFKKLFIGSNVGGISEFIEDGINGLLFEVGNKNELYEKMEYAILHDNQITHYAENLYKKTLPLTDCKGYIEKLLNVYSGVINEGSN